MAVSGPITRAVTASLKIAQIQPCDNGAVALAKHYAGLIDAADEKTKVAVSSDIGPKLLAVLTSLGATVAGRTPVKGGGTGVSPAANALAALRTERGAVARKHRSTDLHSATS